MDASISQMRQGHWLLAACCVLYLAWWAIFFWPKVSGGEAQGAIRGVGVVAILGAAVCGLLGATRSCAGAASLEHGAAVPVAVVGSVVLYLVLLAVTTRAFGRQPTTELVLFVAWLGMELLCAYALACAGRGSAAALAVALAVAGFVVSLVCYVLYYRLAPLPSFVDGCLPLALIGVVSAVLALAM
jgi:hypothetical protein